MSHGFSVPALARRLCAVARSIIGLYKHILPLASYPLPSQHLLCPSPLHRLGALSDPNLQEWGCITHGGLSPLRRPFPETGFGLGSRSRVKVIALYTHHVNFNIFYVYRITQ